MSTAMPCSAPRSAGTCYTMPRCLKPITIGFRSVLNRQRKPSFARIKALFVTAGDHMEEDVVLDDALYALRALRSCVPSEAAAV